MQDDSILNCKDVGMYTVCTKCMLDITDIVRLADQGYLRQHMYDLVIMDSTLKNSFADIRQLDMMYGSVLCKSAPVSGAWCDSGFASSISLSRQYLMMTS